MTITTTHAWLQKHATPTARGGEFHWHPAGGALPALAERLHGASPPCVLWELAPGRVVWALAFAATAPSDSRRYTGLAVAIATGDGASPAQLLRALAPPPARPWDANQAANHDANHETRDANATEARLGDGVAIAGALLSGGDAWLGDPAHPALPRAIAELEALVPAGIAARTRTGTWRDDDGIARLARRDPAGELLAAAWRDPRGPSAIAWRATCELAAARDVNVVNIAREVCDQDDRDVSRALTADERALLGEPLAWPRVVNAWGRGKLRADDAADRLADVLAARVIAELARAGDARTAIADVRWHALLPAGRRAELFATLARRTASLTEVIDA
ncbi:MAG TPA: hypothetical protein VGL61_06680 [Kofleriaceae bacterium]|jgi:hypothetical protein